MAGTDVECGSEYKNLPEAVRRGEIKESDLDRSLRRLLIARFELGDMDPDELNPWTKIPESVVASQKHKELAALMAQKSIVLLQNRNATVTMCHTRTADLPGDHRNAVGGELHVLTQIEGVDGLDQADHADLEEVVHALAAAREALHHAELGSGRPGLS